MTKSYIGERIFWEKIHKSTCLAYYPPYDPTNLILVIICSLLIVSCGYLLVDTGRRLFLQSIDVNRSNWVKEPIHLQSSQIDLSKLQKIYAPRSGYSKPPERGSYRPYFNVTDRGVTVNPQRSIPWDLLQMLCKLGLPIDAQWKEASKSSNSGGHDLIRLVTNMNQAVGLNTVFQE